MFEPMFVMGEMSDGIDIGYPETSDGFVTLVIGKNEEDIGLVLSLK